MLVAELRNCARVQVGADVRRRKNLRAKGSVNDGSAAAETEHSSVVREYDSKSSPLPPPQQRDGRVQRLVNEGQRDACTMLYLKQDESKKKSREENGQTEKRIL